MSKGYHCTCNKGKSEKGIKLYETEVTSEGICIYCGHYGVFKAEELPDSLKPKEFLNDYEVHLEPLKLKRI